MLILNEFILEFLLFSHPACKFNSAAHNSQFAFVTRTREASASNKSCRKAGWSWGCVSAIDANGRTIWIVDAHRDDGRRFIVRADEILTAFVELERQVLTVTFYLESIQ
jgi:hypothetical protein